jgi:uncharacterized membrane protein YqiK
MWRNQLPKMDELNRKRHDVIIAVVVVVVVVALFLLFSSFLCSDEHSFF